MNKYSFTSEKVTLADGTVLRRIVALRDIPRHGVKRGDVGGWLEKEENLSQYGDAWVYGNARVLGDAWVGGNAWVLGDARVYGNARVYGEARVSGNAWVLGEAWVYGKAKLFGTAEVAGSVYLRYGSARAPLTLRKTIAMSLGITPSRGGTYTFYKKVFKRPDGSFYTDFQGKITEYPVGQEVVVKDYDRDVTKSCAAGIHLADKDYDFQGNATLLCKVREEDVICCLQGKVRVKRCFVVGRG